MVREPRPRDACDTVGAAAESSWPQSIAIRGTAAAINR